MHSRVVFLDYDGVVNTAMWNEKGTTCKYNFPQDGKVNNFQAVQWVSELCKKCHYDILFALGFVKKGMARESKLSNSYSVRRKRRG